MRIRGILFLLLSFVMLQPAWSFDLSRYSIPIPGLSTGGLPKDAIPAMNNPAFVPVAQADYLEPTDRVIGVVVGREARAYPIRILTRHEIVNDEVGQRPIAVTWWLRSGDRGGCVARAVRTDESNSG